MIKHKSRYVIIILTFLLIIPVLSMFGIAANSVSAHFQASDTAKQIQKSGTEVIDSYTYIGNTSGTGNHVEAQSLFIVCTSDPDALSKQLSENEKFLSVYPAGETDKHFYMFEPKNVLDIPENGENYYVIEVIHSVPFPDNIMGH
ncbi:MAG: hypothetical protein ACI4J1_00565 [Ruminiclostridium sp.]